MTWTSSEQDDARGITSVNAGAAFEISNPGDETVKILNIQSTCGCISTRAEPLSLKPGAHGLVHVQAMPLPVGDRQVQITLETDSEATPALELTFNMRCLRKPQFLLRAEGDLSFSGFSVRELKRKITAYTVERKGSDVQPPVLKPESDLVVIQQQKMDETDHPTKGFVLRKYHYDISLSNEPASAFMSSTVKAVDAWNSTHVISIPVHIESWPSMRVFPSRIDLPEIVGSGKPIEVVFSIECRDPLDKIVIESARVEQRPLTIRRETRNADGRKISVAAEVDSSVVAKPGPHVFRIHGEKTNRKMQGELNIFVSSGL